MTFSHFLSAIFILVMASYTTIPAAHALPSELGEKATGFSVGLVTKHLDADGDVADIETTVQHLRGDGSVMIVRDRTMRESDGSSRSFRRVEVTDLARAQQWQMWPSAGVKYSWDLKPATVDSLKKLAAADCLDALNRRFEAVETNSEQQILGVPVVQLIHVRKTPNSAREQVVFEKWVAPSLGCSELRGRETKTTEDGRTLVNEREALFVSQDVDLTGVFDSMFNDALQMREILPSELPAALGKPCSECAMGALLTKDQKILQFKAEGGR